MAESQEIELKIHFGGSVKKIGKEDYEYLGELGSKNVEWKFDEILWDRFVDFCKEEALIRAPVGLIWFKSEKEEMKQLRYLYDRYDEEMLMLRSVSKLGIDVVVVFVEHECSEHIPGVIQLSDREHIEDEEHSENDDVDRPKEDDEPEGSEDKNPAEKEDNPTVNPAEKEDNEDGGDEVVADVTDDTNDVRFQSVFEEGEKAVLDKEAYGNGIEEDDSEDERAPVDVEYLDTPVESEDEWEEWNRKLKGKGKVNGSDKYHGDYEKPPYIWLFQKFNSGLEFKDQVLKYFMNTQYDVKMARSESFRIVEKPINKWMVKVCHMKHNHGKSSRISMLKQCVIAVLFREELRINVNLQASTIKDAIKVRYDIVVPISKCYRGRDIALGTILEAQTTQFWKLWDYEEELRRSNQAVGSDADNRMYPIAWTVVRGENKDTWGWFMRKLKHDIGLEFGKDLTVISDKQKGLVHAIELELSEAEHRMCARHIYANWKKLGFSRSEFKSLFWGVAYSYTEGEYKEKMRLVEAYDVVAHNELLKTDPERWCRAFFNVESHCPDVHNNLSESFNRNIKMARAKPMINMLEDIRRQAMTRISSRFFTADKWDTIVTPITMALLEKARCAKKHCSTIRSGFSLYEVNEFDCGYMVDLATHQCACRRWDLTGIPCKHAVCVLDDNQEDPVKYTAEYYYTHVMKRTYSDNIKPVNGKNLWKMIGKPPIGIPEIRKPRGRQEHDIGRKSHLKRLKLLKNCQDIDAYPHVATVISLDTLKLDAKTKLWFMRDQKISVADLHVHATGSSSQSVHVTGSSSQPVEATGFSSDPKPHAKKP
ncbi:PREDICTED: uncharacterized protein LOC106314186 [Brassica oleracea var. oleracea]|uniref:uncharacterized protein LOC106314186 n=1 Tax=Brassica oleracea var. oleracea TaxID=109376 RepID=UPI0006A726FB|nr:PREDICTED: uncharacterized protein LOC106314186 [Brassica oleracea var. oleracea]